MNIYDILQSSPTVHAIGISLIHFLWQGLLVALVLAGVLARLKRSSPQVRYVSACVALLVMAVLPVITFLHVYESSPRVPAVVLPLPTAPEIEPIIAERIVPPMPFEGPLPSDSERLASARTLREQVAALCDKLAPWVASLWLAGVVFLSSHLVGGLYFASMLRRRYASLLEERWQQTLDRLRETLGISRAVALLQSHRIRVPTTMGWIRPAVLLPVSALTGLTPSQIEVLLVHELAHIRRYDYVVSLLQNIAETVLFYHPAVWWVSKQIRNERELCCDDVVLEVCKDAHAYAGALADMLTLRMQMPVVALAASGGSLSNRIRRMLGLPQPRASQSSRGLSATLVLAMLVTICATVAAGLIGAGETAAKKAYAKELLETVRAHNSAGEAHELGAEYEQAIGTYSNARQALEKLVDEFPEVADYRKQLAENYIYMSRSHWCLGRHEDAEQICRCAIDLSEKLVTEFGEDPAYRQVLALSYYSLGRVLRESVEAEQAHRSALALREELVREFPNVPEHRHGLARAHHGLGIVLDDKGELDEAEQAYRIALAVWEELAWEFPDVPRYRYHLGSTHNNLGIVLKHKGELEEAEQAWRSASAVWEELAREFPNVPKYRSGLGGSDINLGIMLLNDKGELEEAEQVYRSASAVWEELAREFPNVPEYKSRLATSHNNLGVMLYEKGELDEAEQAYGSAIALGEELVREFPNVPEYKLRLANSHNNLGFLLNGKGELEEAEQAYRSAIAMRGDLTREFPNVRGYRNTLASAHFSLGNVLKHKGELDEAEQAYRTAIALSEELVREFPNMPEYRDGVAKPHVNLGIMLQEKGELDEAEQAHRSALDVYEELAREFPNVPEYKSRLAISRTNLGIVLQDKGELDEAEQAHRSAIALSEELVREFPNVPEYKSRLAIGHNNLGFLLNGKGELEEAEQAYRTALAVYEELLREFPEVSPHYRDELTILLFNINNLAWRIATSPDVNLGKAPSAVELAKKAVQGAPENAAFWNTLALAHYRGGQWEDTITASGKSRELGAGGHEGRDLLLTAGAHWRLGKKDEARQWYDRAVEWMEQYQGGTNEELNRTWRAMAAELLGISEPTGEKEEVITKNE